MCHPRVRVVLVLLLAPSRAAEAQQPLPELSLEELMRLDAGQVFGASERLQPVTEAPASVSFITAEEIKRYGYRTLADILRGVRGMYVTNDRNFSYLGTRGFGNPGDYNSRVLLLVNGHRVNDNVFGQAEIGAEFGIDPALFERVEIIRGPASSLYGNSAFFAVVNVITRSGASLDGASLTVEDGTLGTRLARASAGRRFANGLDVAVAGTYEQSAGVNRLYFPAFDAPATNNGIAQGLDGERVGQIYGQRELQGPRVHWSLRARQKDVPTASFGTVFNEQQSPEQTTDRHTLADLEYSRTLGVSHLTVRGSFDRFSYDGTYPLRRGRRRRSPGRASTVSWAPAGPPRPSDARVAWSTAVDARRRIHRQRPSEPAASVLNPAVPVFAINHSSLQQAVYLQDEIKLTPWLIANGGLRYDRYEDFQAGLAARGADCHPVVQPVVQIPVRESVPCAERVRAECLLLRRGHPESPS